MKGRDGWTMTVEWWSQRRCTAVPRTCPRANAQRAGHRAPFDVRTGLARNRPPHRRFYGPRKGLEQHVRALPQDSLDP